MQRLVNLKSINNKKQVALMTKQSNSISDPKLSTLYKTHKEQMLNKFRFTFDIDQVEQVAGRRFKTGGSFDKSFILP